MAVHDRLEEARADEAPRHAAQADEDAARADGVHLRHEAVVGAEREAEQEQKDADGPREHLIGDLDDEGLPAEEETHGNPEDKTTHFHDHEAISPLSLRKS